MVICYRGWLLVAVGGCSLLWVAVCCCGWLLVAVGGCSLLWVAARCREWLLVDVNGCSLPMAAIYRADIIVINIVIITIYNARPACIGRHKLRAYRAEAQTRLWRIRGGR